MLNKNRYLKLIVLFFLFTTIFNTGASCNHENESPENIWSQIGGVEENTNEVVTHPTSDLNLTAANNYFAAGEYENALISYQKVLVTNPNNEELAKAYSGIGWATVKRTGSVLDGELNFELAYAAKSSNQDAKIGLASVYLLKDKEHIAEAVSLLESLGMTTSATVGSSFDEEFIYNSEMKTGITNARVHALLAACYYYNNEDAKSQTQLGIAKRLDPASTQVRSIETAIYTLGF